MEHYSQKYDGDKLYFVIGSDELPRLDKWTNFEKIAELVTFYVIPRPDYPILSSDLANLTSLNAKIKLAAFEGKNVSSSEIKVAVAMNKTLDYMPNSILKIITKNNLYNNYKYIVDRYSDFNLSNSRIEHTFRAVKSGILLAKLFDVDTVRVTTALLLHDIAKNVTDEKLAVMGVKIPKEVEDLPSPCKHALVGAAIAKQCFNIADEEILEAIALHTTGKPDMTELCEIVFLADYIEEGRDFANLDDIREIVYQDLNLGMEDVLKSTIDYIQKNGQELYYKTVEAYYYYYKLNHRQDAPIIAVGKEKEDDKLNIEDKEGQKVENKIKQTVKKGKENVDSQAVEVVEEKAVTVKKTRAKKAESEKETADTQVSKIEKAPKKVKEPKIEKVAEKEPKIEEIEKEPKIEKAEAIEKKQKIRKPKAVKQEKETQNVERELTEEEVEERINQLIAAEKVEEDRFFELLEKEQIAEKESGFLFDNTAKDVKPMDINNPHELAMNIAEFLDEKKAFNIMIINLTGKTIIADYFVLASAKSSTAVKALGNFVDDKLSKGYKLEPLRRDGMSEARWVALDYGSVIVHIFHEETREFYQLERLWVDGKNVEYLNK